jgi:transcriptional regulator of acetoin/glycerol metabolism
MPLGRYGAGGAASTVADNRVRFLTDEPVESGGVREAILASWGRSRRYDVAADRVELPYIRDTDLDSPLVRSAEPVLRSLAEHLDGQAISVVLTDPTGVVLSRHTPDAELERHLDRVRLAPGFSYAEEFVGTNGIGTALEGGRPMHVFGHEHYAERLEDLACAGVPISHPVSGKTVGALDLTCWRRDAGPLLTTLAKTTTEQIRQALLADTSMREIELLQEYLRACHRSSGIIFALNNDVVMINDFARSVLDPVEQDTLLRRATDFASTGRQSTLLDLPTGKRARMSTHPVRRSGRFAGIVVHVKLIDGDHLPVEDGGTTTRMLLPGLVGSGALWRRACDEVQSVFGAGDWLAVEGEPGVGKLALLRAAHQRRRPNGRLSVYDALDLPNKGRFGDLEQSLAQTSTSVIITHVDRLPGVAIRRLSGALQAQRSRRAADRTAGWVAVTMGVDAKGAEVGKLLEMFPRSVEVPPLRHHAEDVQRLVPFLLARLGYGGKVTCSPEVGQLLSRASWPGNVEQVLTMLRSVVKHCRTGQIQLDDLPPEILTVSRRRLSPLESIERDAIVRGLLDARDNKTEAARALGMSRATIYRKIHEYGIVASRPSARGRDAASATGPEARRSRRR